MLLRFASHFSKKDVKVFLAEISEPVNFWRKSTAYVDAINSKNYNGVVSRIKRIDYRIQERLNN